MTSKIIVKDFIVSRAEGLHLRYAAAIVKSASRFAAVVKVVNQGHEADGKSILQLLMLGAQCGAVVTVIIEGHDAQAALQAIDAAFSTAL